MTFQPGDRVYMIGTIYVQDNNLPWSAVEGQRGTIVGLSHDWLGSYFVKFDVEKNEHLVSGILLKPVSALEQLAEAAP